jgi:hypothetical protein
VEIFYCWIPNWLYFTVYHNGLLILIILNILPKEMPPEEKKRTDQKDPSSRLCLGQAANPAF